MTGVLVTLAALCAVGAAVRSTWSPCGLSMLSTITPMAERSRGRRWLVTSAWFVLGSVAGGLALGLLAALGAAVVSFAAVGTSAVLVVAAVAAVAAAGADLGLVGPELPHHRRQVNEGWLDDYRGWVYGVSFGAQIGSGLATYIMTSAVYLTLVLAALSASVPAAVAVGVLFGLVRGLAILLGSGLTTPERLRTFHRRFEAMRSPVRTATIVLEVLLALAASAFLPGATAVTMVAMVVLACAALVVLSKSSTRAVAGAESPDAAPVPQHST